MRCRHIIESKIVRDGLFAGVLRFTRIRIMAALRRSLVVSAVWMLVIAMGTLAPTLAQTRVASMSRARPPENCPRPSPGGVVLDAKDLRSQQGILQVDLTVRNERAADGSLRFCYVLADGMQAPTLRLHPGDSLILRVKNELNALGSDAAPPMRDHGHMSLSADPCNSHAMSLTATNVHFHGLTIPPVCHQDDVLNTLIQAGAPVFKYQFRIPRNQPPGLYWYHPHVHGFSTPQVLGGASGALIIEGIERANPIVAGLPERVLIIRDQELLHPSATPAKGALAIPARKSDNDGDAVNTGTGSGQPAKDLSVNYVPVPYPDYLVPSIRIKPGERQLWRVANASTVTYLNLWLLYDTVPQRLGIVAVDGVPLTARDAYAPTIDWRTHVILAPGSRAEFVVTGPPIGVPALFVTKTVDTGPGGENDPNRPLVQVVADKDAPEPSSRLASSPTPLPSSALLWLGDVNPVRVRRLYFSEKSTDPKHPDNANEFYLTEEGKIPTRFDPASSTPNIVAQQGTVEDWIIENRTNELHAFHIHQVHFLLMDASGTPITDRFLRDTITVPYFKPGMRGYPSLRLRIDFRDPNVVGTFVYHCHLLEHEDSGMMGTIRVDPAPKDKPPKSG
ncbi:MAG TPA: multicopper oxidase domain-containing protein [Rhodanobacter sp.]